jgi:hypothetical protein
VNTVINIWVPRYVVKFLSSCTTGDFSRRAQLMKLVGNSILKSAPIFEHQTREVWVNHYSPKTLTLETHTTAALSPGRELTLCIS